MSAPLKLALLGDPVAHSKSPAMQNAALAALGLEGGYELIRCPAGELAERLPRLAGEGFTGLNLTVPLKEEGFRLLKDLSAEAQRLEAVNTLRWVKGKWHGHNSDLEGFATAAAAHFGDMKGRQVLVLGAGGAARAVLAALADAKVAGIELWNRSRERADRLLESFASGGVELALSEDAEASWARADLVVQATSLGLHKEDALPPLPVSECAAAVMDLVTHDTPWLAACRELGLKTADGRDMLLGQGAAAFSYWTGMTAPREAMRRAL